MFNFGLSRKFKLHQPLDCQDRQGHLCTHKKLYLSQRDLMDDSAIIKINSSYLEVVDVYYKDRGLFTMVAMICLLALFITWIAMTMLTYQMPQYGWSEFLFISTAIFPVMGIFVYMLLKESFTWTHFPIRFNRQRKLVHIFHVNGSVKTYRWDEIYFTIKSAVMGYEGRIWYLCGHILAEDNTTIVETFSVSMYGPKKEYVERFWELVRRYMEEKQGVKEVADITEWLLPIERQRESFFFGLHMLMLRAGSWLVIVPLFPFLLLQAAARWFSMQTSKIPCWPDDVEALCVIGEDDPYRYDSNNLEMTGGWRVLFSSRNANWVAVTGKRWKR